MWILSKNCGNCRSLTVAAKVSSTDCNFPQGASLADRIISQAELLGLLAERGCLNMLPILSSQGQGPYVDASILRKLRDRLLEREQWNLALEVSTKAGLDNTGNCFKWLTFWIIFHTFSFSSIVGQNPQYSSSNSLILNSCGCSCFNIATV